MSSGNTKTLREYLSLPKDSEFIIPDYQRGYVWGKSNREKKSNSVEYLTNSLLSGFAAESDIFIQGITYSKTDDGSIELVDGQQRTTFFYLLLKYLGYSDKNITLSYKIRTQSNDFLKNLDIRAIIDGEEDPDEEFQDIFFFKRTLMTFNRLLKNENKREFLEYILDHTKFLCIEIDRDKAQAIFRMMNGNKASMKDPELVKAELLRRASLPCGEIKEVESRDIRGRMAREWDNWLHWWNRDEVAKFFITNKDNENDNNPRILGWLLPLYLGKETISFEGFRNKFDIKSINKIKEAKEVFRSLRLIQSKIQDAYNNPVTYNYIGAILRTKQRSRDRFAFLRWYFMNDNDVDDPRLLMQTKNNEQLRRYFDLSIIGCGHAEIIHNNSQAESIQSNAINDSIKNFEDILSTANLYNEYKLETFRWLLRCNIIEDTEMNEGKGRKFNFAIWDKKSIEHIYPKSKFGHVNPNQPDIYLSHNDEVKDRSEFEIIRGIPGDDDYVNEHSIGNLVLLYGNDNSSFGKKDFQDKKNDFFAADDNRRHFESLHLIHTISVFAASKWGREEIIDRCKTELSNFKTSYSKYRSNIDPTQE